MRRPGSGFFLFLVVICLSILPFQNCGSNLPGGWKSVTATRQSPGNGGGYEGANPTHPPRIFVSEGRCADGRASSMITLMDGVYRLTRADCATLAEPLTIPSDEIQTLSSGPYAFIYKGVAYLSGD
jgi:hypothetical protein